MLSTTTDLYQWSAEPFDCHQKLSVGPGGESTSQTTSVSPQIFQDGTLFFPFCYCFLLLPQSNQINQFATVRVNGSGTGLLLKAPICQARLYGHKWAQECLAKTCQGLNEDWVMRSNRGGRRPEGLAEWRNSCPSPLHCWPPPLTTSPAKIEKEETSSSPVHELAQVRAQEVQETPLLALRVKHKTSDIANTCHILSVKNGLFSKEFQPKTCSA